MPVSATALPGERPSFRGLTLIAGHPALDFLNTVKYRGSDDPQDKLTSLCDVVNWARLAGLLSEVETEKLSVIVETSGDSPPVHEEICSFREQVRILFEGAQPGSARLLRAISEVELSISALRPTANINHQSGVLKRHFPISCAADLKARIVAAVAEMLTEKTEMRIRCCDGEDCDWLFVDRTKAGRRRWCDSRVCGNLARVRRHRRRQQ